MFQFFPTFDVVPAIPVGEGLLLELDGVFHGVHAYVDHELEKLMLKKKKIDLRPVLLPQSLHIAGDLRVDDGDLLGDELCTEVLDTLLRQPEESREGCSHLSTTSELGFSEKMPKGPKPVTTTAFSCILEKIKLVRSTWRK